MLVSHRHRFIYLKTRKTGGTSTEMALEPLCRADACDSSVSEKTTATVSEAGIVGSRMVGRSKGDDWHNHMSARRIRRTVGDDVWSNYFKIANIRNPWDRVVSLYFWKRRDKGISSLSLDEHAALFRKMLASEVLSLRSDWNFYTIDDKLVADHVIRHTHLESDLEAALRTLSLPAPVVGHAKGGIRPSGAAYQRFYDGPTRDLVERECEREIDLFGWVFDTPEPRHHLGAPPREAAARTSAHLPMAWPHRGMDVDTPAQVAGAAG